MNDTEMIECREPALQMQRLIAIQFACHKIRIGGEHDVALIAIVIRLGEH